MAQQIYEVEEIVSMKLLDGKRMFRIKWVGYPSCQNTWEPQDHLQSDLIQQYLENEENKKHKLKSHLEIRPNNVNSERMPSAKEKDKACIRNEKQSFKIVSMDQNKGEGLIFNVIYKGTRKVLPYSFLLHHFPTILAEFFKKIYVKRI